jgi:hypothetical protein
MKLLMSRRRVLEASASLACAAALPGCSDTDAPRNDGTGAGGAGDPTGSGGASGQAGVGGGGVGGASSSAGGGSQGSGGGTGGAGGAFDGIGVISAYAARDLEANPITSFDVANNDMPHWGTTGGSSVTHETGTWWDGGDSYRLHPPTTQQSSGIGSIDNLWKNGTFEIKKFNFRFEFQAGPNYYSTVSGFPKWVIVHAGPLEPFQGPRSPTRPMLYMAMATEADNPANHTNGMCIAPAQGTSRCFSEHTHSEAGDPGTSYYQNQPQPVYFYDSPGTGVGGGPIVAASEIVTVEMRMQSWSTDQYPNGVIGWRVYRRNGEVYERSCAWNWEAGHPLDHCFFAEIQQFGGGYYNIGSPYHADRYTRVGGLITLAANLPDNSGLDSDGWLGPRAGFLE